MTAEVTGSMANTGPRPPSSAVTINVDPSSAHVTEVGQRSQSAVDFGEPFAEAHHAQA